MGKKSTSTWLSFLAQMVGFSILVAAFVGYLMHDSGEEVEQPVAEPEPVVAKKPAIKKNTSLPSQFKPLQKLVVPNTKVSSNRSSPANNSNYDISRYLMAGFDGLYADPDNVKKILESNMSDKAKTLLLSGVALVDTQSVVTMDESVQLARNYYAELSKNQEEFFSGTKELLYNRADVPDKLGNDLFKIVMNMGPSRDNDFNAYANDRIQKFVASGTTKDQVVNLSNAIYASVQTASDTKTGWTNVSKMIDHSKPEQAAAFDQAQMMMSYNQAKQQNDAKKNQ